MYWYSFSSITEVFFYKHNIYSWAFLFYLVVDFFKGSLRTFPDFVKFKDISRACKMNLLFSKFSRTRGNPIIIIIINLMFHSHSLK